MDDCRGRQEEAHPSLSGRPGLPQTFREPSLKLLSIMSSKGFGPPSTSLLTTAGTSAGTGSAAAFLPLRLIMKAESLSKLQEHGERCVSHALRPGRICTAAAGVPPGVRHVLWQNTATAHML